MTALELQKQFTFRPFSTTFPAGGKADNDSQYFAF